MAENKIGSMSENMAENKTENSTGNMTDKMSEIKPYEHKVQYYETDQMGIVHHSNYIRWFEEARTYVLEEIGFGYREMEECGVMSPVLEANAEYKTMTHYSDRVLIDTKVVAYNGIRLQLAYTVRDKETGEVRCTGYTRHCFLTPEGRPLSLKRSYPEIHRIFEGLMEISDKL